MAVGMDGFDRLLENSNPTLPSSGPKPDAPDTGYAYIFVKHTGSSSGMCLSPPKN